jgi:hypothetical protein
MARYSGRAESTRSGWLVVSARTQAPLGVEQATLALAGLRSPAVARPRTVGPLVARGGAPRRSRYPRVNVAWLVWRDPDLPGACAPVTALVAM